MRVFVCDSGVVGIAFVFGVLFACVLCAVCVCVVCVCMCAQNSVRRDRSETQRRTVRQFYIVILPTPRASGCLLLLLLLLVP